MYQAVLTHQSQRFRVAIHLAHGSVGSSGFVFDNQSCPATSLMRLCDVAAGCRRTMT